MPLVTPRCRRFAALLTWFALAAPAGAQTVNRVYALAPGEGVFAYSRISPSGRYLAYSAEHRDANRRVSRTVRIVDLQTREVLFTEPGIDAYWSPDERRVIFLSYLNPAAPSVSILTLASRAITRDVAPVALGDYFSWGRHDGRDVILTIKGNYYYLKGDRAILPGGHLSACPGIGGGDRPLASRDGRRLTTFVRGRLVVRYRDDCTGIIETGIPGGKADFSADGRYIAFHAPKGDRSGYEIQVIDLEKRTLRRLGGMPGSSVFPSWTDDGRLSFRYDADDYHGFLMVSGVLEAPESPLAAGPAPVPQIAWGDFFPQSPAPSGAAMVLVWSTWSAHSEDALRALERFSRDQASAPSPARVAVRSTLDIGSHPDDARRMMAEWRVAVASVDRSASRAFAVQTATQMPMYLLFEDGRLIGERLGAQTVDELHAWVDRSERSGRSDRSDRSSRSDRSF